MIDRSREARRASGMVASSNGLSRRRHRSNSLRDSPDEDGPVELQESVRLRERLAKKDRDRVDRGDRERVDREIIRDNNNRDNREIREREIIIRERSSRSSSKRRRGGDRLLIHGGDGENDTSNEEESVNDEEVDENQENNNHSGGIGGGFRLLQPNSAAVGPSAGGSSVSNHYHNNTNNNHHTNNINLQHRKSFPPSSAAKVFRAAPVWKPGDEMIGVSVPRKARSASIKRSHDWMSNSTGGGNGGVGVGGVEQSHRQASTSPVRQNNNLSSTPTPSPAAVAVAAPPMSPSSSNVSVRKRLKPNNNNGPTKQQHRPPKSSYLAKTVSSSSNAEQLEIEIAEVLFGLKTQSQAAAPPFTKKEILSSNNDSSEVNNRSSSDAKSRVSSPISNSPSPNIQSSPAVILPPNSFSSAGVPLSATAPKRKRPRQVSEVPGSYSVRISPISSTAAKMEIDQTPKTEISSPNLEKIPGSDVENVYDSGNLELLPMPELMKSESEVKSAAIEGLGESQDVIPKEESISSSSRKGSPEKPEENVRETEAAPVTTKANSAEPEVDNQREEKFQIDLEAPPPQSRSSPERENEINLMGSAMDHKPIVMEEMKPVSKDKEDEKVEEMVKEEEVIAVRAEEKKAKLTVEEESESQKRVESKVRNIDIQLDLEKPERDSGLSNKIPQQGHKQPPKATKEEPHGEKTGHSSSLPLPMSMASWPGGLPPMGYMTPIQGVVSMDGTAVSPAPIQPIFSQPRPKRCATHCYIARNIHYLQQFMKMNQFWPAVAATPASLFGSKPSSVVSPADLHGSLVGRAVNSGQEKPPGLAIFPSHGGKDTFSQPANMADTSQRKQQIFLQQAMPAVAPNNILHGPAAFIFPLSQQPPAVAAAAASARPASMKPPTSSANLASTSASTSAAASTSAPAGGGGGAVSFNYPNMPNNETQYLAILQNNAYPFPIPAAVGAPPNYRGTHPQPLPPMFNGSFYSSQIIHASQLQQAQQQSVSQSQQMQQQNHQNTSLSSGSSSSHKHLQSQQQQRPTGSAVGGGNGSGNLHNFPAPKTRQSQQSHQQMNPSQARQQLENETGAEDSPSTADSRGACGPVMNIYGQNFAMPIHPQNYALLATSAGLANATTSSSNQSEKKQQQLQQQQQQQGKNGVESLPPQAFAMSFASMNGASTGPGIDFSSMAQNHALLQSLPEATRHNIQIMAATAAAQAAQRRNFRISEEGKTGGADYSNAEDERKGGSSGGKPPANSGQSIAFSRSDFTDPSGTATNNVVDSSTRSLNLASAPAWTARSSITNSLGATSVSNVQLQAQHQHQQQQQHQHQQMMQLHKQQQQLAAASAARNKNPAMSNGSVYPEHMTSTSSMATKFPNALSGFPQNLVQTSNNSSPSQPPQWKNSARTNISQAPSSFVTSTTSSLKTLQQQQGRSQQNQTQISFGANQKTSAAPQGQQGPGSVQSPSSPMMVGSPSTSSMSKGANGSPRNNSASASSKTAQASSSTTQQAKNSLIPGQRSSPVGGRNVPSILGNPHIALTSNSGSKPQLQQQLSKSMQQAHPYFSSPYFQSQSPQSTNKNASAASGGYYIQRRHPDQQQQPQQQQPPGSSAPSSTAMLTLCPVSLAGSGTSDPAKAMAAATVAASNMKGGGLPSQSVLQAQFAAQSAGNQHQVLPAGLSYVHAVPAAVQVKPAEQKQSAGNDNLHACWQPEKK